MPTREKAHTITELTALLQNSQLAVVTNYRGLNVAALAQLRRALRGKAELHVTKNTLLERAAAEAKVPQLGELLQGPTAVAFITDDIAGSIRALNDFARTSRILTVTGALFGPSLVPADRINELMNVPTRPQLLGQIVGNVQGPLNNLVGSLNQLVSQVVYALQAYADKRGTDAPAADTQAEASAAPAATEAQAATSAAPPAAPTQAEDTPAPAANSASAEAGSPSAAAEAPPEASAAPVATFSDAETGTAASEIPTETSPAPVAAPTPAEDTATPVAAPAAPEAAPAAIETQDPAGEPGTES